MLKKLSIHIAMFTCKIMLALHGWRTGPRPPGFGERQDRPYWKRISERQIASATFENAVAQTVRDSKKRP
jgi:hypothetical protein